MTTPAEAIAAATEDAYSFDRYGHDEWVRTAEMLFARGMNEREVETILRSKWMRWAGDVAKDEDHPTHKDVAAYLDRYKDGEASPIDLARMVRETFEDERGTTSSLLSDTTLRLAVAQLVDQKKELTGPQRSLLDQMQDEIEDRGSREDAAKG